MSYCVARNFGQLPAGGLGVQVLFRTLAVYYVISPASLEHTQVPKGDETPIRYLKSTDSDDVILHDNSDIILI